MHLDDEGLAAAPWVVDFTERILNESFPTVKKQLPPLRHIGHDYLAIEDDECGYETDIERLALNSENVKRHADGKNVKKVIVIPGKLINIVAV